MVYDSRIKNLSKTSLPSHGTEKKIDRDHRSRHEARASSCRKKKRKEEEEEEEEEEKRRKSTREGEGTRIRPWKNSRDRERLASFLRGGSCARPAQIIQS